MLSYTILPFLAQNLHFENAYENNILFRFDQHFFSFYKLIIREDEKRIYKRVGDEIKVTFTTDTT